MPGPDFQIQLARLHRSPGSRLPFNLTACYAQPVRTGLITLPADQPVNVTGALEAVGEGVLVTATATTTLDAQCSRCLTPFSYPVDVAIQELFVFPQHADAYDPDEVCLIDNDTIDLGEVVRDAIILDQPLIPLCRPDCPGLCPRCGADLTAEPGHSHDDAVDERWLGLERWGKMTWLPTASTAGPD
jgi:uncharacterized protein